MNLNHIQKHTHCKTHTLPIYHWKSPLNDSPLIFPLNDSPLKTHTLNESQPHSKTHTFKNTHIQKFFPLQNTHIEWFSIEKCLPIFPIDKSLNENPIHHPFIHHQQNSSPSTPPPSNSPFHLVSRGTKISFQKNPIPIQNPKWECISSTKFQPYFHWKIHLPFQLPLIIHTFIINNCSKLWLFIIHPFAIPIHSHPFAIHSSSSIHLPYHIISYHAMPCHSLIIIHPFAIPIHSIIIRSSSLVYPFHSFNHHSIKIVINQYLVYHVSSFYD